MFKAFKKHRDGSRWVHHVGAKEGLRRDILRTRILFGLMIAGGLGVIGALLYLNAVR